MKSRNRKGKADIVTSRRRFLQSSGAAGIAFAGGLGADATSAKNESTAATARASGGFSAMPADFVYLNSGTEGSMPRCVISALQRKLEQWASDPTTSYEADPSLGKRQAKNRREVGQFLGVGMDNICLTDNTTMGLSMTLMGLNFRSGDRVVLTNHEHNAIKSPLAVLQARLGLQLEERLFPAANILSSMTTAELLDALFPAATGLIGAKALCVSHVYPTTGVRLPLQALRQKADELDIEYLIVDGAQAMGMIDLTAASDNIQHCDFYACPGHKWLNGPPSTGLLYLRNEKIRPPEFYPTLSQRMGHYLDCDDPANDCFPMAKALQVRGCSNTPGFAAMLRAVKVIADAGGAAAVEGHILGLSGRVKDLLLSRAPHCLVSPHCDSALLSGLTAFFPFRWDAPDELFTDSRTANWVVAELLKKKIQVRSIGFEDAAASASKGNTVYAIRVSTAYFNSEKQVEIFAATLQQVLARL